MSHFEKCRKIVAIGRNYAKHAKELGNDVPKEPLIFLKPASSIITEGSSIQIPKGHDVHHEVEVAVVISRKATNVSSDEALSYVKGYAVALDITARDIQKEASKNGKPWTVAKGFDTFTALGKFIPKNLVNDTKKLEIRCRVNDKIKQEGSVSDMIFDIPTQISYISKIMTLEENDIILTGTPEGVGPILDGQIVTAELIGYDIVKFPVIYRSF
eukprot:TRINITY_DN10417_c0_g1_i1.p1 TRINITY_DN10417_c0_g1~~TRINITY_DN10417_c0_g1_i1.p1  ORF type:complete len:214 (-),score=51.63 TRINITY_DN10417_c0_g1_i1:37-678(-)